MTSKELEKALHKIHKDYVTRVKEIGKEFRARYDSIQEEYKRSKIANVRSGLKKKTKKK